MIYAIDQPDVFRSAAGTYVVFGEAKVDDMNKRIAEAQAQAAQQEALTKAASSTEDKSPESITADLQAASIQDNKVEEEDDDEAADETGLDAGDIDIIIDQTQVSRNKAVKALRKHDGDMVNAIMELS